MSFSPEATTASQESYAVYSVLIPTIQTKFLIAANTVPYSLTRERFPVDPDNVITQEEFDRQLQMARRTGDSSRVLKTRPCVLVPEAERDEYVSAMLDYRKKNELSISLDWNFRLPVSYQLVKVSELDRDKKTEIAEANGAQGLYELSAVGFSSDKEIAIVYVGFDCPWCGRWGLHILKKTDGQWIDVSHWCSWMS